ncbi:hypothetical protein CCMA1212_006004 [Trichoderma ghanense]|uniref:NAD-specific glutamate dehydrogenase n=1 Tax=Trichoderma ghanense TaxID=65468 RepID=A0ABY2H210_9HYPO
MEVEEDNPSFSEFLWIFTSNTWDPEDCFFIVQLRRALVVEIVIVAGVTKGVASLASGSLTRLGELEVGTGPSILHLLGKGLISANLHIADGSASHLHGLLEVGLGKLRHGVLDFLINVHVVASSLAGLLALNVGRDGLLDGNLDGALSNESQIGTREAVGLGSDVAKVDVGSDRSLAQLSLEDAETARLVRKRHVDERIQTAGTAESRVKLLGQKLVDNSVGGTAGITHGAATGLGDGVQLVEEDDARSSSSGLVEDVSDVALRLTEPHAEKLGSLDRDEVGRAFVGDSLGQHCLTGTGRAVEEDTSGRGEAKLEEHLRVVDGVLDALSEVLLDTLQATDILPADVGDFHNSDLAESRGVGHAEGESEVVHGDTQGIENLGINGILIEINEVHLLTDLLHGSLGAEGSNIGTDVTVGLGSDLLEVDVVGQLHVLGVDLENLQTASRVGDANVNLAVETTESSQGRVDGVGSVGGGHDDDVGARLHAVHEGEQLRHDTALNFTIGLVSLGGDGIDLVDEDDGGRVLLSLLKGLSQIRLGLSGHLGHNLGTIDEEEESASLVGDSTSHESLTGTGRTVEQDTSRRLDTDGLEQLGMAEGKLDHFSDLSHLLAASTNVVIADLVQVVLLLVALNGLALTVDDGVLGDDAVFRGIYLDDLEFHLSHATTDNEQVSLLHRSVGFAEVWGEEDVEEGASEALDGVGNGEHSDSLGLFEAVVTDNTVDSGATLIELLVGEDDEHCLLSLLAADKDGVATEELEGVHGGLGQGNDAVVIVDGVGNPGFSQYID